jgi:hypothetical protein
MDLLAFYQPTHFRISSSHDLLSKTENVYSWRHKKTKQTNKYVNLEPLKYKIIRKNGDKFYKIVDNTKIHRDVSWKDDIKWNQSTIFDLGDICLLSRIHIKNTNIMQINLEISKDEDGPYIPIEQEMTIVSGKLRVLKVGSLPCKYFKLTIIKGSPIMDFKSVECFGLNINDIKNKFDEETLDILLYNSYDIIYRKNEDTTK